MKRPVWAICPRCDGHGKSSAYLGAVNPDDFSYEEWESYLAGDYDRSCATCDGTGKVTQEDIERDAERRADHRLFCLESGIMPYDY